MKSDPQIAFAGHLPRVFEELCEGRMDIGVEEYGMLSVLMVWLISARVHLGLGSEGVLGGILDWGD